MAERLITFAKRGDLHARRVVLRRIQNKVVVAKLFDEIAPTFADRQGGYTRVLNLGPRRGDASEVCLIELVGSELRSDYADTAPADIDSVAEPEIEETAPEVDDSATASDEDAEESSEEDGRDSDDEPGAPAGPGGDSDGEPDEDEKTS